MKKIATASFVMAAALLSTSFAFGQATVSGVRVTVPFSFTVNDHPMPAGNYLFTANLSDPVTITVQNGTDHKTIDMAVRDPNGLDKPTTLVFHQYDNEFFLSEISFESPSTAVSFPPAATEKRAKSRADEKDIRVTGSIE